jgi:GMP synthase-like glutamine amidotransferase
MKIGILECGRLPEEMSAQTGQYPPMFMRLLDGHGFAFRAWHVEGMEFPASVSEADGWLITGSRHGVYEDHAFIPVLEQFIRDAFAAHVPVVGICFGHQIMAQALGGQVAKFAGGWAVGPQDYSFDTGPLRLNAWHQDQVITPPEGAQTVASNGFCAHAALLYPGRGFSVQAHPEFGDGVIQRLIDHRGPGVVPDALLQNAHDGLGRADSRPMAARIAGFFKQHASVRA